jgi:ribosomal protein L32
MTYLSARPSYDGTRRAIEVQVVGKRAEGTYLEEHLINVRSNPVIAMALLLPLLLALALPALLQLRTARRPAPAASAPGNERMPIPVNHPTPAGAILTPVTGGPTGGQAICPSCGNALRPGARFCSRCGKAIMPLSAPPIVAAPLACPRCGSALRSGARFCSVCGQNTGGGA